MNPTLVRIQSHTTDSIQSEKCEIPTKAVCPCNRPLSGWSDCRQKHPFCAGTQGGVSDRNSESSCRGEERSPGCVAQPVAFRVGGRQPTLSYTSGPVPWESSPTRPEDVNNAVRQPLGVDSLQYRADSRRPNTANSGARRYISDTRRIPHRTRGSNPFRPARSRQPLRRRRSG